MSIEPGIYFDMPEREYHALKLLSSSSLKPLCDPELPPAIFKYAFDHETFEPSRESEIGSAAHALTLQPHRAGAVIEIIEDDAYRSGATKAAREAAYEAGKSPILRADYDKAVMMAEAARVELGDVSAGNAEVTLIWDDPVYKVRCKLRADWLHKSCEMALDLKTTKDISSSQIDRRIADNGHHIQRAFYLRGIKILTGKDASWIWAFQMSDPPFLVRAKTASGAMMHYGDVLLHFGMTRYRECLDAGKWPGYEGETQAQLPPWLVNDLRGREEAGEFRAAIKTMAQSDRLIADLWNKTL